MPNIIELTVENFQSTLIEQSPEQLIAVELYSPRDEAGKVMSQDLVTLANEFGDAVMLTRVNCDEQPQITQQFGVTSVPTLVLIRAGKPLDGLTGITPIDQIKALFLKFLPKPEDDFLLKASALLMDESADINEAYALVKQAYELAPDRIDIKLCYSEILIKLGQLENSRTLLETFALEDKNANYQRLISLLELAEQAGQSPEITALEQKIKQHPDDKQIKLELAVGYSQASRSSDALDLLFTILSVDLNFGDARKTYLDIIAALPDGDPLASASRRKLYSLLH